MAEECLTATHFVFLVCLLISALQTIKRNLLERGCRANRAYRGWTMDVCAVLKQRGGRMVETNDGYH